MSESNESTGLLGGLLRHPLANVIIGFILTGVLGTTLTQYYISLRDRQSKQYELAATRKDSIAKLAALNAEYLARAEMFFTAVDHGDADAARELKTMFDDAAVRWKTETSPTLMAARDVLPADIYVRFRDRVNDEFSQRFLVPLGQCLERGRDRLEQDQDVTAVLADCRAREYLTQAGSCSQALLDMLYELSGYTVGGRVEQALEVNREKYREVLQEACAAPG